MANPVLTALLANTITKVIDSKKTGLVTVADTRPKFYVYDQRDTGDPAPANLSTFKQIGSEGFFELDSSVDKDVYIVAVGSVGNVIVEV